ncbi:ribbon-helix-helix protein, CopG family [bacterium]|nr:ribbon-helix-helix protein, CopG family [bacterium]
MPSTLPIIKVRLPEQEKRRVAKAARKSRRSVSAWVREAILKALEEARKT